MSNYAKGYKGELELVHTLSRMGYMAIRAPRSGRISLASPDVVAAKNGRLIVVECKSRRDAFKIPADQLSQLCEWEVKGGAKAYVGWKIFRKGWVFFNLETVRKNNGNIGKKFAKENGIGIDEL